jgi:Flp pilus assembly protein TadG
MRRKRENETGQTAIMFTIGLTTMFGMVGLVTDVGYAYYKKEAAQAAAQATALAAVKSAYTLSGGGNFVCGQSNVMCYANETECPSVSGYGTTNIDKACLYAQTNGYTSGGTKKVTIQTGTGSYNGINTTYYAVVKVSERLPLLFSAVTGGTSTTLTARSSIGYMNATSSGCVYTLDNTAAIGIKLNGNASITTGCGVWVNSTNSSGAITIDGSGIAVTATGNSKINMVGCDDASGQAKMTPSTSITCGAAYSGDPLAGLDPPPIDATCKTAPTLHNNDDVTLASGRYCTNVNVPAGATLRMSGTYTFEGGSNAGFSVAGQGTVIGTGGVLLYFTDSTTINIHGGATVSLTANTSGDYAGVLMYQNPADTTTAYLTGNGSQITNGIMYFPGADLHYSGGTSSTNTNTTQSATLIAKTMDLDGNSYIQASASSPYLSTFSGFAIIE